MFTSLPDGFRRKTPAEEKTQLAQKILDMIKGKVAQLIFAHDTSRIIQCIFSIGPQFRDALFDELTPELVRMAKSPYARFFVRKILKDG